MNIHRRYIPRDYSTDTLTLVFISIPSFLPRPPLLNMQTVQAPLFLDTPPLYWFFVNPLKVRFFSEPQKY